MRDKLNLYAIGVCLLSLLLAENASAQPCDVVLEEAVQLWGGEDEGSAPSIDINHLTGHPAVVWVANDDTIRVSRFDGSGWSAVETIDTGGILPCFRGDDPHPLPALSLAINSFGEHHILIADDFHLYHFVQEGPGWSAAEIVTDIVTPSEVDAHLPVRAEFDADDVLHVVYSVDKGNDGSGKGVRYVRLDGSGWSEPVWLGSGPSMHMRVGPDRSVHVSWLSFHGMVDEMRNYQGHYRQRTPGGEWLDEEQATDEAPVGNLGPVAIHPVVAVDPSGGAHMLYPVDPPNPAEDPPEAGHASYIFRTGTDWSEPLELFPNAAHAAFVELEIDPAGIIYAFGINWHKRYRVDPGSGFEPTEFWNPANSRWFGRDSVAGPAGAWLAYIHGRRWGEVEVILVRRTGDCGVFCGDGNCGGGEDGCSCLYDCTDQCCIDGEAYAAEEAMEGDPCNVCRPEADRRSWTHEPSAPGCGPAEEDEPEEEMGQEPWEERVEAGEDVSTDPAVDATAEDMPDARDEPPPDVDTTQGGCGCLIIV